MRTNTSMTLNYNNKELHNKPTIHHTFTTVNLHNKNQPKVIMSSANKRSSCRTSTSNSKKQTLQYLPNNRQNTINDNKNSETNNKNIENKNSPEILKSN